MYELVDETPNPARSIQQKDAASDITDPTEISVPAEQETTSVIPIARIAISLPRFNTSINLPYKIPFLTEIVKKLSAKFPLIASKIILTAITRIIQKIGRNSGLLISFLILVIFSTSCNSAHYIFLCEILSDFPYCLTISQYNKLITCTNHLFNL